MPVASSLIKWWCAGDSDQPLVIDLPGMIEAFYGGLVLLAGGRLGSVATSRLTLLEQGRAGMVRCVATVRAPSARGASDGEAGGGDGDAHHVPHICTAAQAHTHMCTHTHIYDNIYGISTCYMSSCEVAELVCLWGWAEGEPPWNSKVASLCTVQAVCHTGPAAGRYGGWYYLPAVVS